MSQNWVRTFESGSDYIESLSGITWNDAPLPGLWHKCRAQTRGWFGMNYTERCACGAIRGHQDDPWMERNQTRVSRARARREELLPRAQVTCRDCGEPYEAPEGTSLAAARQCTRCWGDALVASYKARNA